MSFVNTHQQRIVTDASYWIGWTLSEFPTIILRLTETRERKVAIWLKTTGPVTLPENGPYYLVLRSIPVWVDAALSFFFEGESPITADSVLLTEDKEIIMRFASNNVGTGSGGGLVAVDPVTDDVALFRDNEGKAVYPGGGGVEIARIRQGLQVDKQIDVGDSMLDPPTNPGNRVYATGALPQSRLHAGNFPIIRAKSDRNARQGYGVKKNALAIFINSTGDICDHTTSEDPPVYPEIPEFNDPEDNDPTKQDPVPPEDEGLFPPAELGNPLDIQNPNLNPDIPDLNICSDKPDAPTQIKLCNEAGGGSQIEFSGDPLNGGGVTMTSTPNAPSGTPGSTELTQTFTIDVPTLTDAVTGVVEAITIGTGTPANDNTTEGESTTSYIPPGAVVTPAGVVAPVVTVVPVAVPPPPVIIPGAVPGAVPVVAPTFTYIPPVPGAPPTIGITPGVTTVVPPGTTPVPPPAGPIVTWAPTTAPFSPLTIVTDPDSFVLAKDGGDDGGTIVTTSAPGPDVNPYQITIPTPGGDPIKVPANLEVSNPTGEPTVTFKGSCGDDFVQSWDCTTKTMSYTVIPSDPMGQPQTVMELKVDPIAGPSVSYPGDVTISMPDIDLVPVAANPGGPTTIWLNTDGSLRIGAGNVVTGPAPTIANHIPVYTNTSGQVDTLTTTAAANLTRPLTISSTVTNMMNITSSSTDCKINILSTHPTSRRGSLTLGRAGGVFEFGTDSTTGGLNDFFITSQTNGQCLQINASDRIIRSITGFSAPRYDLTTLSINPGGASTIWANSSGAGLHFGSRNIVVDPNPTITNAIPVYTNTSGEVNTITTTTPAELNRPLRITSTGNEAKLIIENNQSGGNNKTSVAFGNNLTKWEIGSASTDAMYIYSQSRAVDVARIEGSDGLFNTLVGNKSTRYDITPVAANPGGSTTLWNKSGTDAGLYLGASKLSAINDFYQGSFIINNLQLNGNSTSNYGMNCYAHRIGPIVTMVWDKDFFVNPATVANPLIIFSNQIPSWCYKTTITRSGINGAWYDTTNAGSTAETLLTLYINAAGEMVFDTPLGNFRNGTSWTGQRGGILANRPFSYSLLDYGP